jgi:hypothetical protein
MTLPKSNTVLKCSTIEKVAMKPCGHFDYLPQPFMPLRSGVSFLLCRERMWNWVEFEILTTFSKFFSTVEILLFLPAINL